MSRETGSRSEMLMGDGKKRVQGERKQARMEMAENGQLKASGEAGDGG